MQLTEYQMVISLTKEEILFCPYYLAGFHSRTIFAFFSNLTLRKKSTHRLVPNASIEQMKKNT